MVFAVALGVASDDASYITGTSLLGMSRTYVLAALRRQVLERAMDRFNHPDRVLERQRLLDAGAGL